MSDSVKKKWRLLKKNRFADLSEQYLRSRSDNNAKDKEEEEELPGDPDQDKVPNLIIQF
jgi:hypothetical protein